MITHSSTTRSIFFLRFTAICGFLTVLTTLGIHLFLPSFSGSFSENVYLYQNIDYLMSKMWVIVHCILVLIAMTGVFLLQIRKTPGYSVLGLLFFALFSMAEIARQMFVLFYLNGLRSRYVGESDPAIQQFIQVDIENFSFISHSFFGLFIIAFSLGNFFYGLSLWQEKHFGKVLGFLLILWSFFGFLSFANEFFHYALIDSLLKVTSSLYQPAVRGLLAIWVWKQLNELYVNKSFQSPI